MKNIVIILLGLIVLGHTNFAHSYSSYANSLTDPGKNCSSCHGDGRVWQASVLSAPVLTVTTSGLELSLSWTAVSGATGYTLYYAPYPYQGGGIGQINMGASTSISATLPDGAAFYLAITAYNGSVVSGYSNVESFTLSDNQTTTCTADYNPVCGVNGTTYSNNCWIDLAGVEIQYEGVCIE